MCEWQNHMLLIHFRQRKDVSRRRKAACFVQHKLCGKGSKREKAIKDIKGNKSCSVRVGFSGVL